MFSDSNTTEGYQCERTKISDLIDHERSKISNRTAADAKGVFPISTNGSNDDKDKLFRIVIMHQDSAGQIEQSFLSRPQLEKASTTSEKIFTLFIQKLKNLNLTWRITLHLAGRMHLL